MSNDNTNTVEARELLTELLGAMLTGTRDRSKTVEKLTRGGVSSVAALAKKHDAKFILIDDQYEINIDCLP